MKPSVLVSAGVGPAGREYLVDRGYDVRILSSPDAETIVREAEGCEAFLVRAEWVTGDMIRRMPSIKLLARHGVGFDRVDVEEAEKQGIWVTTTPMANANSVAELTVTLVLTMAKDILFCDREIRKGRYTELRSSYSGIEIKGHTIGLIGLGNIGRLVAEKLYYGFGMNIIAYDPYLDPAKCPEYVTMEGSANAVFEKADFISLNTHLTEGTRQSIGMEQFKRMKPTACFINAARSQIVRNEELYEALRQGIFRYAAVDAYEPEPPADDLPLFSMDNVIVTPHIGGNTKEARENVAIQAAMVIDEALSGRGVRWNVNHPENPRMDRS